MPRRFRDGARIDENLVLVKWKGSEFSSSATPLPLNLVSTGFVIEEDNISITLAAHIRKQRDREDFIPHQMVCIRKAQIVHIRQLKLGDAHDG